MSIPKDKFKFVHGDDVVLYDEKLQTKAIGYYQDAWIRFKKNKASITAAIILIFIILMAIIGPYFRNYKVITHQQSNRFAIRLRGMPPKVKGLGWLGLNGQKELEGFPARFDRLPDDIIIGEYSKPNAIGQVKVTVDYYKYVDYMNSYGDGSVDPATGTVKDVRISLTKAEYDAVIAHDNSVTNPDDKIMILDETGGTSATGAYLVQIKFFKFLEVVYNHDNPNFWLGSTNAGDDLFTQMWTGLRISLILAFAVAIINITVGIIVGSIVGYYGGMIDLVVERILDILSGLPFLAILTLLLLRYGNTMGVVILAYTLTGWIGISGLTRTQFYRYKNREYVLAARTLGAKDIRIMARHIFPSALGTLITSLVLYIPSVISSESTFSYLGIINFGTDKKSFGTILADGQKVMMESFHLVLFPSIIISLLILSFNLFGNGLRDAFNPSLRGVEE